MARRLFSLTALMFLCAAWSSLAGPGFWTPYNQGLDFSNILDLALDPTDSNILYAATSGAGIFKTVDGGETWSPLPGTPPFVDSLTIDPTAPLTLFAATNGGLYKSVDGGANWSLLTGEITTLGSPAEAELVVLDPTDSQTVYCSSPEGFFWSEDGGESWREIIFSEFPAMADIDVQSVAFDPQDPDILYMGTRNSGILKSGRGGVGWTSLSTQVAGAQALAVDPLNSKILVAGFDESILRSPDGGQNWRSQQLTNAFGDPVSIFELIFDHDVPNQVYAATSNGVYVSLNSGASWTNPETDLVFRRTQSLVLSQQASLVLYVGTDWGIFRTTGTCCSTWNQLNTGLSNVEIRALNFDPENPSRLYISTNYGFLSSGGPSDPWLPIDEGLRNFTVNGNDLLALPGSRTQLLAGLNFFGLFQSLDEGRTWRLPASFPNLNLIALAAAPRDPSKVFAAIHEPGLINQVFQSENGGRSWTSISDGLNGSPSLSLAVDKQNTPTIYVGTDLSVGQAAGVFKKRLDESSWQPANQGIESLLVYAVAVDPKRPEIVYAGGNGLEPLADGLYKSVDGGENWSPILELDGEWIISLAIDPNHPQVVYAGSLNHLYRSQDRGKTWTRLDPELPEAPITEIKINPRDSSQLSVGTGTRGVWQLTQGDLELRASTSTPFALGSGPLTHIVTITNRGSFEATGVVIDLESTLPDGVEITSMVPSGATTFTDSEWRIPNLDVGQSETLTVFLLVDDAATGWNSLRTEATLQTVTEPDFNPRNDRARALTSILGGLR